MTSTLRGATAVEVAEGVGWIVGVMAVATLGALVVSKERSLVQGWLLVVFSFFWSVGLFAYHFLRLPGADPAADLPTAQRLIAVGDSAYVVGVHVLLMLFLLVPDGRLLSPRWRSMVWVLGGSTAFWVWLSTRVAFGVVDVEAWLARSTWISNAGWKSSAGDEAVFALGTGAGVVMVGLIARSLWGRLRAARGEERQQVKWVAYGSVGILAWLFVWLPQPDGGWLALAQRLYPGLAFILLAVGFGMALFKYRLWDVDLVVRRSLVYGVLWTSIAAIYVGVATGLGLVAGARFPVGVAIGLTVAATLVFQPARRWLEQAADRLVFGRRDPPADVLHSFGEDVAASPRPRDIASVLANIAAGAVRLDWVEVKIDGSTTATVGVDTDEPEVVVPVAWGEEQFGTLRCRPRRGARLDAGDLGLLEALTGQAALAISHARLASRIVHAQERERQRIERNIHDGAQQDLATLVAQVGVARARADGDSGVVDALNRIQHDIQRVLAELRELAQGIHPSVLRDGGLVAAIEDRCSRLPIDVTVQVARELSDRALPSEVEAAAYFFTAEALTNTLKHSGSTRVDVAVRLDETHLTVEIGDAGVGFDLAAMSRGSGIAGLTDRIRALGGEMTVISRPGEGTTLTAHLPISLDRAAP